MRTWLGPLFALGGLASPQELLWQATGVSNVYRIAMGVSVIGDINGDGFEDIGTAGESNWPERRSTMLFLSGRDGSVLRVRRAPYHNYGLGPPTAAGDMDGDQIVDYAVQVTDATTLTVSLQVCSTADDRILWTVLRPWERASFGRAILGGLDLNGDRRPDLLVTDLREGEAGAVFAYAHDGSPLYVVYGTLSQWVWESLAAVGDVDRDGREDFVVGGGVDSRGGALLVSGGTGSILRVGLGEQPGDMIGYSVTGCGDIDRDGVPDFAAGNSDFLTPRGVVRVFSGRTAQPIYTWTGRSPERGNGFGFSLAGGHDVDRDGIPDVIVGAPAEPENPGGGNQFGAIYAFSGRDGTVIRREGPSPLLGISVAMGRPQPGSAFPLFFATEPNYGEGGSLAHLGRIRCYRGSPPGAQVYGVPGRGTLNSFPKIGIRSLGPGGVRIHLSDAAPGQPAALLLGLSRTSWGGQPLPTPLEPFGAFPGCLLWTSVQGVVPTWAGASGVSRGYASIDLPVPLSFPGVLTVHGQWISFAGTSEVGGGVSDALLWRH